MYVRVAYREIYTHRHCIYICVCVYIYMYKRNSDPALTQ